MRQVRPVRRAHLAHLDLPGLRVAKPVSRGGGRCNASPTAAHGFSDPEARQVQVRQVRPVRRAHPALRGRWVRPADRAHLAHLDLPGLRVAKP
ncbi:hypothetical protein JHV675_52820 [Mycobacterium avium subsp. hominissuis]